MKKYIWSLAAAAMLMAGVAGAQLWTNGFPTLSPAYTGNETIPMDTNLSAGAYPQQAKITLPLIKSYVFGNYATASGTATATAGAATLNAGRGVVTTESLTTAAADVYTLTLTNLAISATSIVLVTVGNGTNTTVGPTLAGVTPGVESAVISIRNTHASVALDGTLKIGFVVVN